MSTDLSVPGPPLLCACLKSGRIAPTQQVAKKDHSAWNHPWHIGGAPSIGGLLFPGMVLTPLGVCVASLALTAATDIVEPVVFPWQCTFARHLTFCQDSHWTVSLVLEMSSGHGVGVEIECLESALGLQHQGAGNHFCLTDLGRSSQPGRTQRGSLGYKSSNFMLAYLQDGACQGGGSRCQCCLRGDLADGLQ